MTTRLEFKGYSVGQDNGRSPLTITTGEPFEIDAERFGCDLLCSPLMTKPYLVEGHCAEEAVAATVLCAQSFLKGIGQPFVDALGQQIELPSPRDFDPTFPIEEPVGLDEVIEDE
ncbi:hypothetical protein [Limibacillus sp. MBR-115]|jgi:hypothetical protein|uniref:hypothetical protein n=1 Tax=Limibacillus sp. MBR-115 TaxID=3156465 RepID=UPI003398C61B